MVSGQDKTPRLRSDRLLMRPACERDIDDVFEIYSDIKALQYFAREPLTDRGQAERMVAENFAWDEDPNARFWAICLSDTDRMIGAFTLFHISERNHRAEIGYILNRAFWGNGYATEALQHMIAYCFGDLGLVRLEADVDPENTGSLNLLDRNGFKREGYFRKRWLIRGQWYDSVMFALIDPDFD